jgi:hypothetical protein
MVSDSSGAVMFSAELAVREYPPDPVFESGYVPPDVDDLPPHLINVKSRYKFLSNGLRGVAFCLADSSAQFAALHLTGVRPPASWRLEPLSQWTK